MNLNKALLIGNLTRDPEMRSLPNGQSVASFGVATNSYFTKDGKREERAEFHNVVAFGRLAEIASQYLSRGKMVFVEGRIQTRSWEDKDGNKKSRTEIVAERMQLGPRPGGAIPPGASTPKEEEVETVEYGGGEINPEEIPF